MIFDRGLRRKSAGGGEPELLSLNSSRGWTWDEDSVGMSRDRAMKVSTVNRCVEVLSSSIALLPVYIMDEGTKRRFPRHRLGRVLWGRANEAMTSYDYEKLMECNRLMKGNAYAWIHRSEKSGYPLELIPLDPEATSPRLDGEGRLWYLYRNPRTGELTRLSPADVLHYKAYSKDGIEGISVLTRAALTVQTGYAAQEYQNAMYQNGGRPSGILKAEGDLGGDITETGEDGESITIKRKEKIRREWEKVYSGPGNSFRVAVMDHGMSYQPISLSNSEAQFVESEEVRVADVCRFFGVPLHLAYAGKQSYNSNEQNSLEFTRYTLQAAVTEREQEDSYKLLLPSEREAGLRVRREMKVFLRGDTTAQAAWYRGMREAGVYSVNDIRALEDLEAAPGGESRYASWNYGPLERFEELSVIRALGGKRPEGGAEQDGR